MFLIGLAIFMIVGMSAAKYYLDGQMDKIEEKKNEVFTSYLDMAERCLEDLDHADKESYALCFNELERAMCFLRGEGVYVSAYIGDQKIIDTNDVTPIMIILELNQTPEETETADDSEEGSASLAQPFYYFLADTSLLDPLNEYEDGKYSPEKFEKKTMGLQFDTLADYFYDADSYEYQYENIYIDKSTHRFYPGVIKIVKYGLSSNWVDEVVAKVDCSPKDKNGLMLVKSSEFALQYHSLMHFTYDRAELTEDDVIGDYTTPKENGEEYVLRHSRIFRNSMTEVLPVTFWVVIGGTAFLALFLSFVIALILYHRKKVIWEVFEYQKKTTEAMAHDLKTPLATISAYAERLEDKISAGSPSGEGAEETWNMSAASRTRAVEDASRIRASVNDMNAMLEGILEFSKSDVSDRVVKKETVYLLELVEAGVSRCKVIFEKKGIEVEIKGENVSLMTDRSMLSQTIDNLITNCSRYAEENSVVEVVLSPKMLTISNQTSGPIANVEELKKPFVKGDKARGQNGTGLGLAIADNNLRMLGYMLKLSSENNTFTAAVLFGKA